MPQINTNKTGGVVRWDHKDWLAGVMPNYSAINDNSTIGNVDGFLDTISVDPFRKWGYLSPGGDPTAATGSVAVDALLVASAVNGTEAYLVGGTKLQQFTPQTNVVTNTIGTGGVFPHTISAHGGHSAVVASDVVRYTIGTTPYIFYSWSDNTDGDVGRYDLTTTFDDDYMSAAATSGAVLTSTEKHVMVVGDDDILYIADGRNLHGFDGSATASGTFISTAIQVPVGFVIKAFAKTQNYLIVYASDNVSTASGYRSESIAFFWDYKSDDFTYKYPIDGNKITAGFTFQGTPGCFSAGRSLLNNEDRSSKLQLFNGSSFSTVLSFKETAPTQGGVEVMGEVIRWNSNGDIYQYGSPYDSSKPFNKIASGGGSTAGGFLKNLYQNEFYLSSGTTSSGGLDRVTSNFADSAKFLTGVVEFGYPNDMKIKPSMVKIYWDKTVTGKRGLTLLMYNNKGSANSATLISQIQTISTSNLVQILRTDTTGNPFRISDSIQIFGQWVSGDGNSDAPVIRAIEVYFDFIK